jgi:CRP-like cAMP-binding protein
MDGREIRRDAVALLASTALFGQLSPAARRELAAECRWSRVGVGHRIFARGESGSVMYIVVDGAVALSVSTSRGDEVIFDVLRPVATFGELSLIDGGARIATATAYQASVLAYLPTAPIQRLLHVDSGFALAMLTGLARMVRRVDDRLADQTLLDLRSRVIKYLSSAAGSAASTPDASAEIRVDLPLTQAHLARLVGGSRQQVNRIIVDLERRGAIRRQGAEIVAISPRALLESRLPR